MAFKLSFHLFPRRIPAQQEFSEGSFLGRIRPSCSGREDVLILFVCSIQQPFIGAFLICVVLFVTIFLFCAVGLSFSPPSADCFIVLCVVKYLGACDTHNPKFLGW